MLNFYSKSFRHLNASSFSLNESDLKLFSNISKDTHVLFRFVMFEKSGRTGTAPFNFYANGEKVKKIEFNKESIDNSLKECEQTVFYDKSEIDEVIEYYSNFNNVEL
jgi:hypothetical protein